MKQKSSIINLSLYSTRGNLSPISKSKKEPFTFRNQKGVLMVYLPGGEREREKKEQQIRCFMNYKHQSSYCISVTTSHVHIQSKETHKRFNLHALLSHLLTSCIIANTNLATSPPFIFHVCQQLDTKVS